MFSTVNSVKEYTGYDTTLDLIKRAQAIVEIYVGKDEIEIENVSDLLLLDKITAYQTVYMLENEDMVFKQIAATSVGSAESQQTYNTNMFAPFMAPLAVIAANGLSFRKSKAVRTGRILQRYTTADWRNI
jgi:hypothetical protein